MLDRVMEIFVCIFVAGFFVVVGLLIYHDYRQRSECTAAHGVYMDDRCFAAESLRIIR